MKCASSSSRSYLVVLLASTLVPCLILADQVCLNSHSDDKYQSDGHSNKGQLPSQGKPVPIIVMTTIAWGMTVASKLLESSSPLMRI